MKNAIGHSEAKQHNDDRETVRGRSESDSAGKACDSSRTSCKGGLYFLFVITESVLLLFFLTGDGVNLRSKPVHLDDICHCRADN